MASSKVQFGLDVTPQAFSTYKSLAIGEGKAGGRKRTEAETPRVSAPNEQPVSTDAVAMVRNVKMLVDKYGADAVKELAGVLEG